MGKRISKCKRYWLVMSLLAGGILFALNGKTAEAKYQYSIQKKTVTENETYQVQQEEDQRIVFLFQPKQSGVYIVKVDAKNIGVTSVGIGFQQDGSFATSKEGGEEYMSLGESVYCEKGKVCPISVGAGKYIGGAGDAIKSLACNYRFQIVRTNFRAQKLTLKKGCTLNQKDYGTYTDGEDTITINPYVTFRASKTGYYRFYAKNRMETTVPVLERTSDGSLKYVGSDFSNQMYKLEKGKQYILNPWMTGTANKFLVQYAAKKRTITLDYNYPWKNGSTTWEYDVAKGDKLGVLLPPDPTENQFAGNGKTHKKYKFLGWYTEKEGGKKITAKTPNCKKIKKLYAHWKS